eukprot:3806321-Amphidinium_carterae.2
MPKFEDRARRKELTPTKHSLPLLGSADNVACRGLNLLQYVIVGFFVSDVLLNFSTGYITKDKIVMDLLLERFCARTADFEKRKPWLSQCKAHATSARIVANIAFLFAGTAIRGDRTACAQKYFFGWFWIDSVATFPFDLLLTGVSDASGAMSLVRIAKARARTIACQMKLQSKQNYYGTDCTSFEWMSSRGFATLGGAWAVENDITLR